MYSCTGVGINNRGIESFFREAFDGLKRTPGIEGRLLKGAGGAKPDEIPVWCLPRTGRLAAILGNLSRRNSYVVEQWSSFFPAVRQIRRFQPHVIFYSDSNLGFLLFWFRKQIGVPYRLLFSNGGPCGPPFIRCDFVHQVAPLYYEEALRAGEPPHKHFMVPYGIKITEAPTFDLAAKLSLRRQLGLPTDRKIVLSVGWIARQHKRMHYVIEEIARMPQPRPFLQLLGAMDGESPEVVGLGNRLLGPENLSARSVSYQEVADFYKAADCFVLASLKEGFGRVYLEALMHGLPVIAHRHPVMEYVLGDEGAFGDLDRVGTLSDLLTKELTKPATDVLAVRRWQHVREHFTWEVLAPQYREMFAKVAGWHFSDRFYNDNHEELRNGFAPDVSGSAAVLPCSTGGAHHST